MATFTDGLAAAPPALRLPAAHRAATRPQGSLESRSMVAGGLRWRRDQQGAMGVSTRTAWPTTVVGVQANAG